MKRFASSFWGVLSLCLAVSAFTASCVGDGDETIVLEDGTTTGIPSDSKADPNPEIDYNTTTMPNVQYMVEEDGNAIIVRLDMTGVQDAETHDWLKLYGTAVSGQNIWVEVDGKPKGIQVINNSDNEGNQTKLTDLVFLVDNSGSMSEEAEAIARDITSWGAMLEKSNLDIRYGCVGYGRYVGAQYSYLTTNYGVAGAMDLNSYEMLDEFLNNRGRVGVDRTAGYYGENSSKLESIASERYNKAGGECGVQALRFADENFSFRTGANRIYVNFTDDANYPATDSGISISYVENINNWGTNKGTIHSVISNDTTSINMISIGEPAWRLSWYTGGTVLTASSSFSGVTLASLPVTGALQNSYIIRFTNIDDLMDGQPHKVKITILSADGKTRVERTFWIVFGTK